MIIVCKTKDRNYSILCDVLRGQTLKNAAIKNNITSGRVRQIVFSQCRKILNIKNGERSKYLSLEWLRENKEIFSIK